VVGAPVFALVPATTPVSSKPSGSSSPGGTLGADSSVGPVWCGLATKEIASWQPGSAALSEKIRMNGHTGWVRSLATSGRYLLSCGCNHLRQWDTTYTIPKEVSSHSLFTGDILAIAAAGKRVFTAGADGSVRAWALGSKGKEGREGELRELASREKAHDGRVTALAAAGSLVFSVSYDGRIKVRGGGARVSRR
jgi:WD40 repeat protein